MRIERLSTENLKEGVFCVSGQPGSDEWYEQLDAWLDGNVLRGRFARADDGTVMGFVLYLDLEKAPVEILGEGYYMMQCLFVRPDYQLQGVGKALIESALTDARACGAAGFVCEGWRPAPNGPREFLPETFFQHRAMPGGESRGPATLYYTMFDPNAPQPRYAPISFKPPQGTKIRVDILDCRRCYHNLHNRSLIDSVMSQIETQDVSVHVHDQTTREAVLDKGMSSGVLVDGKLTYFQGPMSEADVLYALDVAIRTRRDERKL
jgi:GNAT superfamily N-acetyltransferase